MSKTKKVSKAVPIQSKSFDVWITLPQETVDEITEPFRERIVELEKQNKQLLDSAESAKINELKDEVSKLKHELEMSPIMFDSEKELKAYKKFCKKHEKCQLSTKANGGKVPYIVLNGTGVGTCKKVICQVCGKEQDITDISVW